MKVKMLETVQGRGIRGELDGEGITLAMLSAGDVFIVDEVLGNWLVDNRKAEKVAAQKHYGAQPEPELRHDDEIIPEILEVLPDVSPEPVKETENETPNPENHNRSRRQRNRNG